MQMTNKTSNCKKFASVIFIIILICSIVVLVLILKTTNKECDSSTYGSDCLPCPVCDSNTRCDSGKNGNGTCIPYQSSEQQPQTIPQTPQTQQTQQTQQTPTQQTPMPTIQQRNLVSNVETSELNFCGMTNVVALTFDDGPNEQRTPLILQELASLNIKATFFISPSNIRSPTTRQCEILRNMVNQGHNIQSHTFNHFDLQTLDSIQLQNELTTLENWVSSCLGSLPNNFNILRPPFGSGNRNVVSVANYMGYSVATWNIDTKDYEQRGLDSILQNIESQYRPGHSSIVLMHDHVYESRFLEHIVNFFITRGNRFITMSECLNLCRNNSCRDARPGYPFFAS